MRYFLDISYDGSRYHGWQIQENAQTVQSEIQASISKVLQAEISITGSGRTDTGVHALQQIAHFDAEASIDMENLQFKLNSILPKSIAINSIQAVKEKSHARFDAVSRLYHYFINTVKDPFLEGKSFYFRRELNLDRIARGCDIIKKTKDFKSFSKVKTEVKNFECDIQEISWNRTEKGFLFAVRANRFLRGMVRAMVGTLIELGENKLSRDEFDLILKNKDRSEAGASVPPYGLYLAEVTYPENIYIQK